MAQGRNVDPRDADYIVAANVPLEAALDADYQALGAQLVRRGLDIEAVTRSVADFSVALPSWGVGTGGTRFARFPGPGEPRNVFEKLEDCAVVHRLTGATPTVSLHLPWDACEDYGALKAHAARLGLGFDAVNSNTFQDQRGQRESYQFGSLTHTSAAVRAQAIEHNLECIRIGRELGSQALTLWIGDGANFPGQQHLARAFERYLESASRIYAGLPADWRLLIEHKMYEPAFYATVIQDWGSSLMAAQALGPKAYCLVDLGHHAPNVNIEMIVARLIHAGRLGGFHFNDSKYGDDDLDAGSIDPYRLFLVFNELADAAWRQVPLQPAHMLDQSHNVTDPIESLMAARSSSPAPARRRCWSIAPRWLRCRRPTTRWARRRRSSARSRPTSRRSWRAHGCAAVARSTRSACTGRADTVRPARRRGRGRPAAAPAV